MHRQPSGRGLLGAHCGTPPHARKGNWRGARVDEILWGKWSLKEELRIPRVLRSHPNWKEPVQSGTSDARDQPKRAPLLSPAFHPPKPPHWLPKSSGRGRTRELRSERGCRGALGRPGLDRAPARTAAKCRDPIGPGSHGHARIRGMRASGQGPQRRRRGWATRDGSAVTFRDPQPRQPAGGARALRGPDPRGPARAHQAGPLLAGARRSQHMVGGAPPRPAETGCSRYRIRDRQRETGPGRGRRHARPGRRRQGWGAGGGCGSGGRGWRGLGARVLEAPGREPT